MAKVTWIRGEINPPVDGEYYMIQECLQDIENIKAGEVEIFTDGFTDGEWESLGAHSPYWRVICWARILHPDIPRDLQGRVRRYFGKTIEQEANT